MTVRSTESRLPRWDLSDPNAASVDPGQLGQYVSSGRYHLISYLTSPLLIDSRNDYVVIATEPGATQYAWKVVDDAGRTVETDNTSEGVWDWTPSEAGEYWITVTVSRAPAANVELTLYHRAVAIPGTSIHDTVREELIEAGRETGAAVDDNVLSRATTLCHVDATQELLFELAGYVHQAALASNAPTAAGADHGIPARLLAAVVYAAIQSQPKAWSFIHFFSFGPFNRTTELEMAAEEINEPNSFQLTRQIDNDLGVCDISGATAAMLTGAIPWKELPADKPGRRRVEKEISDAFEALIANDQNALIDIFNLLRFPKSNIALCARLLAQLKNRANRWPALTQTALAGNETAIKTIVTELFDGATPAATADVTASSDAASVWSLMRAPYIATYFADIAYHARLYGGHTLARGAAGMAPADIQALQSNLRELGFFPDLGLAQINGVFDDRTEWAVRELQIYARMDFVAHVRRNAPAGAEYSDRLRTAHNLLRHGGPVSGVVDPETAWKIQFWMARS